jgi:tetratricopeptide (TPR) repeat protein
VTPDSTTGIRGVASLQHAEAGRDITVVAGNYIAAAAIETAAALHQLPSPPRDFTGRVLELDELTARIERDGVNIVGLQGLGGIGKTALALKLAERLAPRYPDAQFYLDLKGAGKRPLSVTDALSHVIRAFQPASKLPEGEAELQSLYLSLLHNQRALLLMDNAAAREQVEPLIPPDSCVLLVTSRTHFTLPGLFALNVETLPDEDARRLLLKIAPRIGECAEEIARLCDYLPLALRLAASALAERVNMSPGEYVRRLSDAKTRLGLVEASLTLSYELLTPEMQSRWRALAVFPDTFDTAAAAAVWESEADAAQDTLGELLKYSLLAWNGETARYRLHDLTRLFADARLSEEERSASRMRHAAHYLSVLLETDKLYKQGGEPLKRALALFDSEWRNIRTGQAWAEKQSGENETAAALCSDYPSAGIYLLMLRQHPREQISWLEAALVAARKLKARAAEGSHLGNLGNAYAELGETRRAVEFHEQALIVLREMGDRRDEGNALGNLGLGYAALGEPNRAVEFYEQHLAIAREIGDRRGEGNTLGNLGLGYAELGEPRRAAEFYEQQLLITREIGDRRGEGNALGNLGIAYKNLGEPRRAVEFYEQHLAIARELGDRRGEGNALFNTSLAFEILGDRAKAIAHAEAALEIYDEIESPYAAKAREQLAKWRGEA